MNTRTIAASILTLGLLTTGVLAANMSTNYNDFKCSEIERRDGSFADCKVDGNFNTTQGFSANGAEPTINDQEQFLEGSTKSKAGINGSN